MTLKKLLVLVLALIANDLYPQDLLIYNKENGENCIK